MSDVYPIKARNIEMIEAIAEKLDELCEIIVFVGGATTGLFISEKQSPDVRQTFDVDCIVDVSATKDFHEIERNLRKKGFAQSIEADVICRWYYEDLIMDIMPTDSKILGFTNKWYKPAIKNAQKIRLMNSLEIKTITAPYFIATKIEAFQQRGNNDCLMSHDLEDIISILDGRSEITDEVEHSNDSLKIFIADTFHEWMNKKNFQNILPGHLNYGAVTEDRVSIVWERMNIIANLNPNYKHG